MFNVIADGWSNGRYCLGKHVASREAAQKYADYYTAKYEGKPYPNGQGFYACRNFRVVEVSKMKREGGFKWPKGKAFPPITLKAQDWLVCFFARRHCCKRCDTWASYYHETGNRPLVIIE